MVYLQVNRIAAWFPDPNEREQYQAAAARFRVPYWDWAVTPDPGQNCFPDEFTEEAILTYGPMGYQTILNPLFCYRFQPLDPVQFNNLGVRLPSSALN